MRRRGDGRRNNEYPAHNPTQIFVPVPQEWMGRIIGTRGCNIRQLAHDTRTDIRTCSGDDVDKGPGFLVSGTPIDCENTKVAIQRHIVCIPIYFMFYVITSLFKTVKREKTKFRFRKLFVESRRQRKKLLRNIGSLSVFYSKILAFFNLICKFGLACLKESVPQPYIHLLIKRNGNDNFRVIEEKCGVKITWPKISGTEQNVMLDIKGLISNCEHARVTIRENIVSQYKKKWQDKKANPASSAACQPRAYSKEIDVPKKYIGVILGKSGRNKENIETKSGTQIRKLSFHNVKARNVDSVRLKITGPKENCDGAETRIKQCIAYCKEIMLRNEFGGDTKFVCFAYTDENEKFRLKPCVSTPVLDDFIRGGRYRIETELDHDGDDDDCSERDISGETILTIKKLLLTSLQKLKKVKEEKQLIADLWCHFGQVFFSGVDEEEIQTTMTPVDVEERIITSKDKGGNKGCKSEEFRKGYWKSSFEEGIHPTDIKEDQLPKPFDLELVDTLWSYDFEFETPSNRAIRLKAWEELPPDSKEPPAEVKNILGPLSVKANGDLKAWICYPSTSVFRADIMSPKSKYDCRMKLRAGYRDLIVKDVVSMEEYTVLSDYLSNCNFDKAEHRLSLPNENDHKIPEGFVCVFHRVAEERMFKATFDEECFSVILMNQNTLDTDSSKKRDKEQVSVLVEMKSWSEAMLSPEPLWEPEEIVEKLEKYMDFLSSLQSYLFNDG